MIAYKPYQELAYKRWGEHNDSTKNLLSQNPQSCLYLVTIFLNLVKSVNVPVIGLKDALNIGGLGSAFHVRYVVFQPVLSQVFVEIILEVIMQSSMLNGYVKRLPFRTRL